jgi:DNA-binding MltR family transcriptional regulator
MAKGFRTPAKVKALLDARPGYGQLFSTLRDIVGDAEEPQQLNDRARMILGCAILEQLLRMVLAPHFAELDDAAQDELFEGANAPLASLSARIKVAHALGVFGPKTRRDLDRIRSIRNACAHSRVAVHFSDPAITEECDKFNALQLRTILLVVPGTKPSTAEDKFFVVLRHYFLCFLEAEPDGALRYKQSKLGHLFN